MEPDKVVLPFDSEGSEFVELARTSTGKVFKKQILKMNSSFLHPANKSQKITIDETFAKKLVDNFKAGYCDIVQFPKVNDRNQHVESPDANMGEVVDLTYDDNGVYAFIDVRENADKIGKTFLGASAMMHLDYEDKNTGNHVGPTLLHVAATNRPYLTNLEPYESVSLSASDDNNYVILSTDEESSGSTMSDDNESEKSSMDKLEELLAELKNVYDIDVEALQKAQKEEADDAAKAEDDSKSEGENSDEEKAVEDNDDKADEVKAEEKEAVAASDDSVLDELVTKLSDVLKAANPDLVSLSDSEVTVSDVANAVVELSRNYSTLQEKVGVLTRKDAEAEVDKAVREGRILPVQRNAMVELRLSDASMYEQLVPEEPIVKLSNESGISVHDSGNNGKQVDELGDDISRIAKIINDRK